MNESNPRPLNILLGVDGSEHSLAAALLIRDLPLPDGSQVVAIGVLTANANPPRHVLLSALDQVQATLHGVNAEIKTGLAHGHPAEELIKMMEEYKSNLIVVGAQGLRATLGILLGGVAQQVVEYAHHPVLVVRAPYVGIRRVLLVTDGSSHSERAADYLARFPFHSAVSVEAMHVLPPVSSYETLTPIGSVSSVSVPPPQEFVEAEENQSHALLDRTAQALQKAGMNATTVLTRGDAATEIIAHARASSADLIVAGARGMSAVKGWLLGSLTRKLVHYAPCSVLIVRQAEAEA